MTDAPATALHEVLHASAARAPDQRVYVDKDGATTYAELLRASMAFAGGLRARGLRPQERVAVVLDRTVDFLVSVYGIWQAGGTVVPLHADTRTEPLCRALAHSGAAMVVLDGAGCRWLGGQAARLPQLRHVIRRGGAAPMDGFEVDGFEELVASSSEHCEASVPADALAMIAYTSGSTGLPKGVMLSHRNVLANLRSIVAYLELGPGDIIGMVLPYSYAYGMSVLHSHILAGGTIADLGSMAFPERVVAGLDAHGCTGFAGVPSTLKRLLDAGGLQRHDLDRLRYVQQAGAAMTPALTRALREALPHARVFVMYGQTEATARLAWLPPEHIDDKPGSVGRAIPGVSLTVADDSGAEVPRGTVGEVLARGDNVMVGYLDDPDATRCALRDGALRTGDRGWMDADGFLFLEGRASEIIKSGAHRIGPFEIERVLEELPGVHACAVTGVPDDLLGQVVAAFVVQQAGVELERQALMRHCLAALPRHKLPAHVWLTDALPTTGNGKVCRADLAAWLAAGRCRAL